MRKYLWIMVLFSQSIWADQLWVFYHKSCYHCELFINQAYSFYPKKELWASKAPIPLIRMFDISMSDTGEKISQLAEPISSTPTFVLIDDENGLREIGRFSGYSSESEFYSQLSQLVCSATKHVKCDQKVS